MSLNDWSIIYFIFAAINAFAIVLSTANKITLWKISIVILTWIALQTVTILYAINTNQVGFYLMFGLNIVIIILSSTITKLQNSIKGASK